MNTAASPWARATTIGRFLPRNTSPVTWLQARNTPAGVRIHKQRHHAGVPGPEDARDKPGCDQVKRHQHTRRGAGTAQDAQPLHPARQAVHAVSRR